MKYPFIDAEKANYPITVLCRTMRVAESGYHAWIRRGESKRSLEDRRLKAHIRASFAGSAETYGSPRILLDLREAGERVGKKRVARLMREENIAAKKPKRFKKTTDSKHSRPIAPNIVERRFDEVADAPNKLWVTDLTYVWTWEGWMYVCVFLDVFSRKVVGWAAEDHMEASLVTDAVKQAFSRRLVAADELVCHSDRGSQYASEDYLALLKARGITPSMSRVGDCWDNAVAESFWATLKGELLDRRSWPTRASAKNAIAAWIDDFYNRRRRHSSLGYVAPIQYERLTRDSQAA